MQVHEGMSRMVLTVGPGHTLRAVARLMSERQVGAAVVMDPDGHGPGIITERDILVSVGAGQDPDVESVADAPDPRRRLRGARLVAGGGRRRDGARRLSPSDRARRSRDGRHPVGPRHRALLDRGWSDLSGASQGGRGVRGAACLLGAGVPLAAAAGRGWGTAPALATLARARAVRCVAARRRARARARSAPGPTCARARAAPRRARSISARARAERARLTLSASERRLQRQRAPRRRVRPQRDRADRRRKRRPSAQAARSSAPSGGSTRAHAPHAARGRRSRCAGQAPSCQGSMIASTKLGREVSVARPGASGPAGSVSAA